MASSNGNSAPKVIGLIMVLAICLLGTFSSQTMTLQSERLDNMRGDIIEQKKEISSLIGANTALREKIATMSASFGERFKEVETQFKALREYTELRVDDNKEHLDCLDKSVTQHMKEDEKSHAVVKEKVNNLERYVFNNKTSGQ